MQKVFRDVVDNFRSEKSIVSRRDRRVNDCDVRIEARDWVVQYLVVARDRMRPGFAFVLL